jgi:glycerol-3-phosphate dehydrogenase
MPLLGGAGYRAPAPGSPHAHLAARFGTEAAAVSALVGADPSLAEPLVAGLPYLRAEAVYAVRHEMAVTLDDVLSRRTRARLFDRNATVDHAEAVAALIAPELGWSAERTAEEVAAYVASCASEAAATTVSTVAVERETSAT